LLINPAHTEARYQRGTIFLALGLYDQAITDYSQALNLNPLYSEQATAYLNCGLAYLHQGDCRRALVEFNRALRAEPGAGKVYCHRAEAYYRLRRYPAAWADLHQAQGLGQPLNPEFLRLLLEKSSQQPAPGDYADFYLVRGNEDLHQGLDDLAMDSYNQAIKINPDLAAAYHNRGLVKMRQGRYNLAGEDFNRALAIDPQLAEAYWNRGLANYYREQYEAAWEDAHQALALGYPARSDLVPMLQKILAREPASAPGADYYLQRGTSDLKQGLFDQAISEFIEALNLNPESAEAYLRRGIALKNKGLPEQAVQDFTQALRHDPNRVEAYYQRAVGYFLLQQYDLAWADVHQVHQRGHQFSAKFLQVLHQASGRRE
jgi:tetratricopeptide (TPR) repeat protein